MDLKHPLQIGKTTISKLSFRDYTTAADYLSFDKRGGVAQNISLIASLSGTAEELIMQLRGPDYREASRIVDALIAADDAAMAGEASSEKKSPES